MTPDQQPTPEQIAKIEAITTALETYDPRLMDSLNRRMDAQISETNARSLVGTAIFSNIPLGIAATDLFINGRVVEGFIATGLGLAIDAAAFLNVKRKKQQTNESRRQLYQAIDEIVNKPNQSSEQTQSTKEEPNV